MNRLYRSLLLTGIVAVGLAGCGDDVTVVDPPPPPPPPAPQVRSVTVTPDNVAVNAGQQVQMSANVSADAGATPTIAWSSSDLTRATVSASGLVDVLAAAPAGPVSIRATATCATACGTASGAATLNVVSATANAPTVSIAGITTPAGVTVPLAAAAGQMQVIVNLDRQSQIVSNLELIAVSGTDTLVLGNGAVGAPPQAVRAEDGTLANAIEVITIPFNSAAFSCIATGCTPTLTNKAYTLAIRVTWGAANLIRTGGNTAITFANPNGFSITAKVDGTPAVDANGLTWQGGNLTVTAQGVIYTPGGLSISQVTLQPGLSQPFGSRLAATTITSGGSASWPAATTFNLGQGSGGYETLAANGPDCVIVLGSSLSNGQPGPTFIVNRSALCGGAAPFNPENSDNFMIDNKNPTPGVLVLTEQNIVPNTTSVNCCAANWIGSAYNPAAGHTALTTAGAFAGAVDPTDGGSGVAGVKYYAGAPSGTNTSIVATGTVFTTGADLPASNFNTDLTIVAEVTDVTGNTARVRLAPGAPLVPPTLNTVATIGVDLATPQDIVLGSPTATIWASNVGNDDPANGFPAQPLTGGTPLLYNIGTADNNGLHPAGGQLMNIIRNFDGATAPNCAVGSFSATAASCRTRVNAAIQAIPGTANGAFVLGTGNGYYTSSIQARDFGGNLGATNVFTTLVDVNTLVDPNAGNPLVQAVFMTPLASATNGGQPTQYTSILVDDVDLLRAEYYLAFGGGGNFPGNAAIPMTELPLGQDAFGQYGAPLEKNKTSNLAGTLIRSAEFVPGGGNLANVLVSPSILHSVAFDVATNFSFNNSSIFPALTYAGTEGAGPLGVANWVEGALPGTFVLGTLCGGTALGGCAPGTVTSVGLTVLATGPQAWAGPQNPGFAAKPFARVDLFYVDQSGNVTTRRMATTSLAIGSNVGANRVYTYSATFNATGVPTQGAVTVFFVGYTPGGDITVSPGISIGAIQ